VKQTIYFNTKLFFKLSAYLVGQESLTCLRWLHIIHSSNFFSRIMEPARNSHCYTFLVPSPLNWRRVWAGHDGLESPTSLK